MKSKNSIKSSKQVEFNKKYRYLTKIFLLIIVQLKGCALFRVTVIPQQLIYVSLRKPQRLLDEQ